MLLVAARAPGTGRVGLAGVSRADRAPGRRSAGGLPRRRSGHAGRLAAAARRGRAHLAALARGSQPRQRLGLAAGHPARSTNYATVLTARACRSSSSNSFLVAIPAVLGTVLLSSMAGFALAKHDFPRQPAAAVVFVARQPGAVPGADDPGARPDDRAAPVRHALGAHPVPHRLPDRLLHAVHAQLHPRGAGRRARRRAPRGRGRAADLLVRGAAARPAGARRGRRC